MKKKLLKVFTAMAAVLLLSVTVLELNAEARAGGSRSMGARGSRSYSRPATPSYQAGPSYQTSQPRQPYAPAPNSYQQPAGGGFMRSMAGGLMGGMLGSMLFSGMAGAGGMGDMGTGGGIGLFEIILLAGGGYLIYRFIKRKPAESPVPRDRRPF
ncbi:hypothetical protein [Geobacter sp. SVR]|uniref:hypothetical protein n=1 Tax=Geobacter sp. SVR TaxID=2495594 RepID=UPI00143F0291|nr:hypothetical protein [Geobacter sp. SVR]BCS54925.1 hypothetical protein GSVR_32330 [Geobacter sp. SVR]GCF86122.1 hypothetical protein GSbR_27220 [Geobacter sp. SVR]